MDHEDSSIDFDIDRYLRNSKRLDLSDLDWDDIPNHPLSDGDVMCLHYMMDIETHTVIYLRDLLATRAAHDPYVTGVPLAAGSTRSCGTARRSRTSCARTASRCRPSRKLPDGSHADAHAPEPRGASSASRWASATSCSLLPTMLGSLLMRDFVALHMTWGAINELTTLTGYHQLIRRSEPPGAAPDAAPGHPGRAPPLRLLPRAGQGAAGPGTRAPAAWCAGR